MVLKKIIKIGIINIVIFCVVAFSIVLILSVKDSYLFYHTLKNKENRFIGTVYQSDAMLGYRTKPDSRGVHILSQKRIPINIDQDGFRVKAALNAKKKPLILAIGDSFTFGFACAAEEAFPYKVAQQLGGSVLNAGVPSYSIAQMLILSKELIPKFKPDLVLVQYSDWLVDRAKKEFHDSEQYRKPIPYYFEKGGSIYINPPVFTLNFDSLNISDHIEKESNMINFLLYYGQAGLPLYLSYHSNMLYFFAKRAMKRLPQPCNDSDKLVQHTYRSIQNLCEQNGAEMLVVSIHNHVMLQRPIYLPTVLYGFEMAEVTTELYENLTEKTIENYYKKFVHWGGSPLRPVDLHPNAAAHDIITQTIFKHIQSQASFSHLLN